jgi:hypothetical protein
MGAELTVSRKIIPLAGIESVDQSKLHPPGGEFKIEA